MRCKACGEQFKVYLVKCAVLSTIIFVGGLAATEFERSVVCTASSVV